MSQQHIEELENRIFGELPFKAKAKDIKLIIEYAKEQAERVQELEEDNENLQTLSRINRKESMRLHEQNKSYRKILEKVRQNMIGHYKLGGERDTYVRWSKELIDKVLEDEE